MSTPEQPAETASSTPVTEVPTVTAQVVGVTEIPEGAPRIYANYAQATAGPHDVVIRFGWYALPVLGQEDASGQAVAPGRTVVVPAETLAVVTIPLGLVDALINLLAAQAEVARRALSVDAQEEHEAVATKKASEAE
jgi:hypothetical protein